MEGTDSCAGIRVQQTRLEDFVVSQVRDQILTPENLRELTRMVNEELRTDIGTINERLDAARSQVASLDRRLQKHYEAMETGALSLAESGQRIRQIKAEIDDLRAAEFGLLEQLEFSSERKISESRVLQFASDLRETLASGDVEKAKLFLAAFIEGVDVDDDGIEIRYHLPVTPVGLEQDDPELVLQTVPQSGA